MEIVFLSFKITHSLDLTRYHSCCMRIYGESKEHPSLIKYTIMGIVFLSFKITHSLDLTRVNSRSAIFNVS